jgi:hypothetical protein
MKLGAERKKVLIFAALMLVAVVIFMVNSTDSGGPPAGSAQPARPTAGPVAGEGPATDTREPGTRASRGRGGTEFRPSLKPKRGEERIDPTQIDPTLRLDLLAKLQSVKVEGSRRSVFDFSEPPAPKPDPTKVAAAKPVPSPLVKPEEAKPEATEPAKPQAPPVPFKFYGYLSRTSQPSKRAFFMEGDEIHVVAEGEVVKKRYKIVRIGVNSVVVEDTQFKQEQTLPLLEEQPG